MTRVFNTKKELAERLMAGEKWRVIDSVDYCYYCEECQIPFRFSDGIEMNTMWEYCDGVSVWEQVINKPKTKTVWFWKVRINHNVWHMPAVMYTEKEIKSQIEDCIEYKRLDILGSEEVEV